MHKQIIYLPNQENCEQQARCLAHCLTAPFICTFKGDMGSGKTTFIRAMLRELGVTSAIKSPTFSLVESYACQNLQIHHFDLYRIVEESELDYIGFNEYFGENTICCIEWPERAPHKLLNADLRLSLEIVEDSGRQMTIEAGNSIGEQILSCLIGKR
ncbi:tRNA (adenosine(37)-N6)-threonylcarbamoyltransferase complex ATPase subunit type 1 TsaE [Legionella gresilensis]|uniref:tRNA (adenosine(37)-N6)-threonylcarbamoyltransferase complex ATPase subunit type 1 TsaE n=1 Tax=Legionella gresilensis TaxID=91823 RepID=UPI0010410534|nr:tRNA (adenosine(37)-N6)-threonylcarbamoyltransferase complex ATPase subunit type 1 TsaE [Legionella gresilensis]